MFQFFGYLEKLTKKTTCTIYQIRFKCFKDIRLCYMRWSLIFLFTLKSTVTITFSFTWLKKRKTYPFQAGRIRIPQLFLAVLFKSITKMADDEISGFHWLDYVLFAALLLVSFGIGIYAALSGGKQRTTRYNCLVEMM